jgi:hypothetical protein
VRAEAETARDYIVATSARYRLLLGDWRYPLVRDPIDLLRLTFPLSAIGFAIAGDANSALHITGAAVMAYLARLVEAPRRFDLGFLLALTLEAWGNPIGLFANISWFDDFAHIVITSQAAPMAYLALVRLEVVPDPGTDLDLRHALVGTFAVTLAIGLAIGACFEMYEYAVNQFITHALGTGYRDTVQDLAWDGIGALAGGGLLALWTHRRWPTRRKPVRALEPTEPS